MKRKNEIKKMKVIEKMKEKKYIIAKIGNKYIHIKSATEDHDIILKHNNIPYDECIEKGIIIGKKIMAMECRNCKHWEKIKRNSNKSIYNDVMDWIEKNEDYDALKQARGFGGYNTYKRRDLDGD